ncbi:hypothetical protein EMIHUDRAFT_452737 [Emiliania huxleyi CCMP1516]|uniref:PDZ domain-containing protein n=2 Tax=Emiliania huxleyi TaxID=2903 RepID=A0A0D3IG92_EMIH1|nr:hypothetical protein EMIHUDRAFT_452737 [Emiliania huxleyi CCMP1516]EOD10277.1 hypothetical protein EMIHUDRAFT_452737 [Emiliania huxleyi CCMP1516]|eukprot:XP_005762706.1 hypothetical protein EMIHUDRAFT_452737 [Emiliania huxleyi CCMP1516]
MYMHVLLPTPPCVHAARAPQPTASGASTAIGLAVLSSVVLVHEAGHFSAAAVQKMRVEEFSIGFGPRIFALRPREGGVRYVLRALPLGGYVAFPRAGEAAAAAAVQSAAEDEGRGWRWWRQNPSPPAPPPGAFDASDPALFENRPFPQQAAVVSAGVIANLLLAWSALFGSAVSLGVPPSPPVTVSRVVAGGAADAAGLRPGDRLVALNQRRIAESADPLGSSLGSIRTAVSRSRPLKATVERSGRTLTLAIAPPPATARTIGVVLSTPPEPARSPRVPLPPGQAAGRASELLARNVQAIGSSLLPALRGALGGGGGGGLQGPLAISSTAGKIAEREPALLPEFAALLSVNLAVFNALPLPGLDGFQLLLLAVEARRGRKLDEGTRATIDAATAALFLVLVTRVLLSDVGALGSGPAAAAPSLSAPQLAVVGAVVAGAVLFGSPADTGGEDGPAAQPRSTKRAGARRAGRGAPLGRSPAPQRAGEESLRGSVARVLQRLVGGAD